MQRMYVKFVHYRFLIFFCMKPPCYWHTVMTVTVPFNEITGMWRHSQWCEVLQTFFFFLGNPCTGLDRPLGFPVVSPTNWPPLHPRRYSWVPFSVKGWVESSATGWLEGLCQHKIPMIPSGIEPVNFQLVVQCLNQLRQHVPPQTHITQLTFDSTHYGTNSCDIYQFCTWYELHNKHTTHNKSMFLSAI